MSEYQVLGKIYNGNKFIRHYRTVVLATSFQDAKKQVLQTMKNNHRLLYAEYRDLRYCYRK